MSGIIATRNYYPGDLIYSEDSFVQVLPRKFRDILCEWCCKRSYNLRSCKQCMVIKYCGKTCQRNDWSTHRLECVRLKNLPENSNEDTIRLLGKLILKIKDKDWKVIKKRVMGTDFSFDDIDSHYKDMTENPRVNLYYREVKELLHSYIGKENMPGDLDMIKIIGKVRYNTFNTLSLGCYIGSSKFGLECIPNTNMGIDGRTAKIWAIKKISKGIDKISIPSRQILSLKPDFLIHDKCPCKCTDCSLPYGESVLTRIIDDKRAYSIICDSETILNLAALSRYQFDRDFINLVDEILQRQEGVLGKTNHLHLKLLALKCLKIGGPPHLLLQPLLELEEHMKYTFGEFYSEMIHVYKALAETHFETGNLLEVFRYTCKAEGIRMQQYINEEDAF